MSLLNKNKCGVVCEWMENNRTIINPDGQVIPCCYLANILYAYDKFDVPSDNTITAQIGDKHQIVKDFKQESILMEYWNNKDKYNIHKNPLIDILNEDWFTKTLPESWDDSDRLTKQCRLNCVPGGRNDQK